MVAPTDSNPCFSLERARPWVVFSPTSLPGATARCHSRARSAPGIRRLFVDLSWSTKSRANTKSRFLRIAAVKRRKRDFVFARDLVDQLRSTNKRRIPGADRALEWHRAVAPGREVGENTTHGRALSRLKHGFESVGATIAGGTRDTDEQAP